MEFSTKQQVFIDAALAGHNVYLSGKAGTGKSYVTKHVIAELTKAKKKVISVAPTGVAANNIGGATIHSVFALTPYGVLNYQVCNYVKSEKRTMFKSLDTIVIDEISMLRPDMLDAMNWTLIKNGCRPLSQIQIIFVGDLKQLEPVVDDNMLSVMLLTYPGIEFHNATVYKQINPQIIELDEVLRQSDTEFINNLNIIRDGRKSEYFRKFMHKEPNGGVILAPHNHTVTGYNLAGLMALEGVESQFEAKVNGNARANDFNVESLIRVKQGAKIMYLANSQNNNLHNGTLGTFEIKTDIEPGAVNNEGEELPRYFIKVGSVEYALKQMTFTKKDYVLNADHTALELKEIGSITQYPIRLAYALTIHKSQGLTFDEVTLDLSVPCFSDRQVYVGLSRVTGPAGLRIICNRP